MLSKSLVAALIAAGCAGCADTGAAYMVKGDGITLGVQPDGDDLLVTSGWPRPLEELRPGECVLNVKSLAGGTITFQDSYAIFLAGGFSLKTGPGRGAGVPMISMPKPNKDDESFFVDAVGCEWRFPEDNNFSLRGIQFAAQAGARITFKQDGVRLAGVKVSGQ